MREINGLSLIFRISGVYSPHGTNFLKTMLRLARQRDEINVVSDQFSTPTSAKFVADTTALVLNKIMTANTIRSLPPRKKTTSPKTTARTFKKMETKTPNSQTQNRSVESTT